MCLYLSAHIEPIREGGRVTVHQESGAVVGILDELTRANSAHVCTRRDATYVVWICRVCGTVDAFMRNR